MDTSQQMRRLVYGLALGGWLLAPLANADEMSLRYGYLQWQPDRGPALAQLTPEPEDSGLQGARLGISDNMSTGRFLGQSHELESIIAASEDALLEALSAMLEDDIGLIVLNVPAQTLRKAVEINGDQALLFNAAARDVSLRLDDCSPYLLHTAPSHAMLTDALAQWLSWRRWRSVFLISGQTEDDQAWADAFRRSAEKFALRVVADKEWTFEADMRRNASAELPLFTQGPDYDVVVVADERNDFGDFVPFNTWLPRPVAGTQGMAADAWHPAVEAWGAAQLQNRFHKQAERHMTGTDYAAWAAIRAVGEAMTRTESADMPTLRDYLLGDDFELAAFKGRPLSFRDWNGQLRQPVPLAHPNSLVGMAPFEGFLHQHTELDTLGYDRPESRCHLRD
ncbi:ABC transporter substrate-binding protein [Halomonas sp. M5N1S17]|uniref:ABC transporter substrate-binding protein n=1 Tax=Halomonas alkalisoli TaxID=2907158 RepID=UPI001F286D8F|nr:ABC transporter substrate-binding protein [Halomonas alkalisoli]MCE9665771.1 ABC transporter substrate-binding protein [Halomonas alkalisoli]